MEVGQARHYAKTGGVLSIVAGGFSLIWAAGLIALAALMAFVSDPGALMDSPAGGVFFMLALFYGIIALVILLIGALAVTGGVFAIRRRVWGLALAGAIAAVIVMLPCGVVAVVFTALGKPEFETAPPAQGG